MRARCSFLQGLSAQLAHVPVVRVWRGGFLHRGFCTVHIQSALSRELWAVRSILSAWIPGATSAENKDNFHLSFDSIAEP